MAGDEILGLFDSFWFEHGVFRKKALPSSTAADPDPETEEVVVREPKLSRLATLRVRSMSDQNLSTTTSFASDSFSPNSVLATRKLQTILSGKEAGEFSEVAAKEEERVEAPVRKRDKGRMGRMSSSKSLSDLEFEELKGFMDLGFVFSEEDRNSSLASIIPGLHRLGKEAAGECLQRPDERPAVSRPYLSEAWGVLDQRKIGNPVMNWKIPALVDETEMKDHLKFWAHAVASTVR